MTTAVAVVTTAVAVAVAVATPGVALAGATPVGAVAVGVTNSGREAETEFFYQELVGLCGDERQV